MSLKNIRKSCEVIESCGVFTVKVIDQHMYTTQDKVNGWVSGEKLSLLIHLET